MVTDVILERTFTVLGKLWFLNSVLNDQIADISIFLLGNF